MTGDGCLGIPIGSLARIMPLFLLLDGDGHISEAGPTLTRINEGLRGADFFDSFEVRRPRRVRTMDDLRAVEGQALHLRLAGPMATGFRAVGVSLAPEGAVLLNLSLGIQVAEAVSRHSLTHGDFAATDLTIEMLYLVEAKAAAAEETRSLIARLEAARSDAEARSMTDALTGLPNRRGFEREVSKLAELGLPFAVFAIDLDYFKAINDTHGHGVGDAVLREAARRLTASLRQADIVARVGGDEFLAILRDTSDETRLIDAAERLVESLKEPIWVDGVECRIAGSVGIARHLDSRMAEAGALIDRADAALYVSKRDGRGRVTIAERVTDS